jgi:hypothetical protein
MNCVLEVTVIVSSFPSLSFVDVNVTPTQVKIVKYA